MYDVGKPCLPVLILYSAAYVSWNFDFSRPTRGPPRLLHASSVLLTFPIGIMDVPGEHVSQEIAADFSLRQLSLHEFRR